MNTIAVFEAIRRNVKAYAPRQVVNGLHFLRSQLRRPPIDDVVLANFQFVADERAKPRLNLVMPRLGAGSDFGGMATGIDIFFKLYLAIKERVDIDVRLIVTDVIAETDPGIVTGRAEKFGITLSGDQVLLIRGVSEEIPVRRGDLFNTYNWWTTLNFAKLRDEQAKHFKAQPLPLLWLMQDYEPAFMGFSSGHLLAFAAYETTSPLWGVINSSNLAAYIEALGQKPDRAFVFEPVISNSLLPYLEQVPSSRRDKRILVYGRPTVERNCFPALVRGLRHWLHANPQYRDWEIVSAGMPHDPIDLGAGQQLVSLGKLTLDEYAKLLLSCRVGVSLMASPHPSYPPLEMAHFGLRTVTNTYFCKNLDTFHPNIISTASIAEESLAEAITLACQRSEAAPPAVRNPEYIREDPYPFLPELSGAIAAALA